MTPEQWRGDPAAQRKTWITLAVCSVMLTALMTPSGLMHSWHWRSAPPPAEVIRLDTPQARPPVQVVAPAPVPPPVLALAGKWKGAAVLAPNHGLCELTLEVTAGSDGTPAGYTTLFCQPPASDYVNGRVGSLNPATIGKSINPTSAILRGTLGPDGVTHFTVTKNIGVGESEHGCNMTTAEATPFNERIAFEWHEENCPGGQIVLGRTR